jgi:hypothetical protein
MFTDPIRVSKHSCRSLPDCKVPPSTSSESPHPKSLPDAIHNNRVSSLATRTFARWQRASHPIAPASHIKPQA